jgi:acyl-CoA thioester hydrolase
MSDHGTESSRPLTRSDFAVLWPVTTRWSDNDMFGHLNNAVYYELFDTAINGWLDTTSGTDAMTLPAVGVVAESRCTFLRELAFPEALTVGLRVTRVGRSSVTYQLGVFGESGESGADTAAAIGYWVHVYIDAESRMPVPIPDAIRAILPRAEQPPA